MLDFLDFKVVANKWLLSAGILFALFYALTRYLCSRVLRDGRGKMEDFGAVSEIYWMFAEMKYGCLPAAMVFLLLGINPSPSLTYYLVTTLLCVISTVAEIKITRNDYKKEREFHEKQESDKEV